MTCPLCREELKEAEIYPNNKDKRDILSLKIRCDKHEEGCHWIGELRERNEHNQECGHVAELCGNNCGELVMRKDRKNHEKDECSRRIVGCCYCDEVLEHRLLSPHYTTCAEYPASCPHQCGRQAAQKNMETHTSREGQCPNSPFQCEFTSVGCQFVGNRKELQYHLDKGTVHHLSLAVRLLHSVTERLAVTETRQKETDSKLAETEKQQEVTKKLFEQKQKQTDRKLEEAKEKQKETEGKLAETEIKQRETEAKLAEVEKKQKYTEANLAEAEKKTEGKLVAAERKQKTGFETVKQALESELKSLKAVTFFIIPG
ncbi:TNF receptor-associated factor 5-like [Corticium candelabrum]|uniref:TNF receptor-associated factor 5-like n=1 Tax=Corticium candelabrum TaxID=121492 RepID=UPI002E265CEF|nr:TNF receptor-associated factor 5-like [Corticium candelabrum]